MPLYHLMQGLFRIYPISNLTAIALLLFSAFLILYLISAYDFISVRTFLPSNIYVLIVCGFVSLLNLHPVYFGAVFLLLSLSQLFTAFNESLNYNNAFNAGFFLGVGTLFYAPLFFFFLILPAGFTIWSTNREWRFTVLSVLGAFLPLFFAFSYYFFIDSTVLFREIIDLNILYPNDLLFDLPLKIYLGFLILIFSISSLFIIGHFGSKTVSEQKFFQVFFFIFIIAFLLLLVIPAVSFEIFVILAIPVTFLLSNYLIYIKRKTWGDIFMIAIIGFVIYMHLACL